MFSSALQSVFNARALNFLMKAQLAPGYFSFFILL